MDTCKKAAESLDGVIYVVVKGDGKQLPHGCVLDNVTPEKTYVYWNKNGGATSFDPNLQTICQASINEFK